MARLILLALALLPAIAAARNERAGERELMVLTIENIAATAGRGEASKIAPAVLRAMREVPRHRLVPEDVRPLAYGNHALPIGHGQTISQPYVVALMTDLLEPKPGERVLEIGTGSGYQAALLARLAGEVFTIEIVAPLAARAAEQLRALGYSNVAVRAGDGYAGWPERAPFDKIIVTAGADHVPKPLIDQLRPGGRMVIPLGKTPNSLELTVIDKGADGRLRRKPVIPVRFVPLTRRR